MSSPPDRPHRSAPRAMAPWVLLALAGACSVSAALGLTFVLTGHGPAPLPLLGAPPVLVLVAAAVIVLRATRRQG